MMKNLSDAERNRIEVLMKEIEQEEPALRLMQSEQSFSSNGSRSIQGGSSVVPSSIEDDRLTIVSAAGSQLSLAKSMIGEGDMKKLENIDSSLRQLVPIDKWEMCSLKPNNQRTLSTIQDI